MTTKYLSYMLPADLNGVAVLRMAPHEYKVAPNIGKRNCIVLEELCKFVCKHLSHTHYFICFV